MSLVRKREIQRLFKERWKLLINRLSMRSGMSVPHLTVLSIPWSKLGGYYLIGWILITIGKTDKLDEVLCIVDHEIVHYIQFLTNSNVGTLKNWKNNILFQLFGEKAKKSLVTLSFIEGFAVYIAFKSSGIIRPKTKALVEKIAQNGVDNISDERLPYALGYLVYHTIELTFSESEAISLGLRASPFEWEAKGREAYGKLNIKSIV